MATSKKPKPTGTTADFDKLAKKVAKLEAELRAMKRASRPKRKTAARPPSQQEIIAEQARRVVRTELDYTYLIASNVMGDISRLLGDQIYGGIGAPRAGKDAAYEEVRLSTASSLVSGFADEMTKQWLEYEPTPGQPWAQLPPSQARRWMIGHLRRQVERNLPRKGERVVDGVVEEVFTDERPSLKFDRVNGAPRAADEGSALAQQVILNVFDQVERDIPGLGQPGAAAEGTRAVEMTQQTLLTVMKKYRPARPAGFATHEELFADCYTLITTQTLENVCNLAGFGATEPGVDGVGEPRRMAGAILTDLGICQHPNPDQLDEEELNKNGLENGVPAERPVAVQLREMIRVLDVVQDSLFDGALQYTVQALYQQRVPEVFPGQEPRVCDDKFISSGWKPARNLLERTNVALYKQMQKEDGWSDPRQNPPERKTWSYAVPVIQ